MKILQVIHNFYPNNVGGSEVYTYGLCKELSSRHEVLIFCGKPRINSRDLLRQYEHDGLRCISVNRLSNIMGGFVRHGLLPEGEYFNYLTFINKSVVDKAFVRVLKDFRPDIIHFQHLRNLSANLVSIAHKFNIPVVFTLHDYWLLCPKTCCVDYNLNLCSRAGSIDKCARCLLGSCLYNYLPWKILQLKPHSFFLDNLRIAGLNFLFYLDALFDLLYLRCKAHADIVKYVDLFIAPSSSLGNKFIKHGLPESKIVHVEHGINAIASAGLKKADSRQLRFAFIGSVAPYKGIHTLIEAFNKVNGGSLDIYGCLGEDSKKSYLKLIKNSDIRFKGYFDNHGQAGRIFSGIDVLLVPSICEESSSLAIREAFSCKIPVIASDIGAITEIVRDGKNGFLFKPGDANELSSKIQYLIDNPQEIDRMRNNIVEVKSIKQNAGQIEDIYRQILNRGLRKRELNKFS